MALTATRPAPPTPPARRSVGTARGLRGGRPSIGVVLAMATLALVVLAALFPTVFATTSPTVANPARILEWPSAEHWLGTDEQGRDIFSRVVHGARSSLTIGILATVIGLVGGGIIGVVAGYASGAVDRVLSRLLDVLLAFPDVLLALISITILGIGQSNLVWAIGIGRIPGAARLVRSQVISVRTSLFVQSGVALGLRPSTLVLRHVVPNSLNSVLIASVIGVGTSIIFGASLSFLGLGASGSEPEWGWMLSQAQNFLRNSPWVAVGPGVALTLTVVAVTVTGQWLQNRYVSRRSSL